MAANTVQTNVLDRLQRECLSVLVGRNAWIYIVGMWSPEGVSALTDDEISAIFPGKTQAEALAAKNALDAILTALGDPTVTNSNANKLMKFLGNIPG